MLKLTADLRRSDSPPYQPGQKVWLSTRDIRLRLPCKKLAPRYVGPFVIQKQINPVTFQLKLPPQCRIHPTFHVSLLKTYHSPVSPSTEPGPITEPPLPVILEDGAVYEVRTIFDSRHRGGWLEYLVDWEGYGLEERSWIPRDDILDPALMEEFHSNFPNRPGPEVGHHVVGSLGPQERAMERGVMSQISQAPPPISHCHLSFNSNHLHLINPQLSQHYLSTHLTSVSCPISLTRSGLTPTLHGYLPQDRLPPVPVPRWSSVSPTSACLRPSPQLIFGVGPRRVLNHVIHEFLARKPSSVYPLSF